jgi:hypothetical protein
VENVTGRGELQCHQEKGQFSEELKTGRRCGEEKYYLTNNKVGGC